MSDWIGYVASVLVAISITMKGGLIFRIFNLAGSICFFAYGIVLGSMPIILINIYGTSINIFHIIRLLREKKKEKNNVTKA